MTPEDIASLAYLAWPDTPWSLDAIKQTCRLPTTHVLTRGNEAFLMAQIIPPEAEIYLIATDPDHRRKGFARDMLLELKSMVSRILLEVRADNDAALRLYQHQGFEIVGRRKSYYLNFDGPNVDALTMTWTRAEAHPA